MGDTTTGQPSVSASRARLPEAWPRTAAMPARITGRRAARTFARTSAVAASAAKASGKACAASGGRSISSSIACAPTTSAASVMCTGPGRSAMAVRTALRRMIPAVCGWIVVAHLQTGAKSRSWSITWWVK